MIKALINDLAHDKIKLSQALTRSKIIAAKVKNETFKKWIVKELEGYEYENELLPEYRKVNSATHLKFDNNGYIQEVPLMVDTNDHKFNDTIRLHRFCEPISIIEEHLTHINGSRGRIDLPVEAANALLNVFLEYNPPYNPGHYTKTLKGGFKEVSKAAVQNIVEQTKQKLLDTLLELESEFPDLLNDFKMTEDNLEKVQTIINNNIYGGNNPVSIASGNNVEQTITNNITLSDLQRLKELGVEPEKIQELENIVTSTTEKSEKSGKIIKWLSAVTSSMAARGLYDNIPQIMEFVQQFI